MSEKQKKKLYQRWWVWVICVILVIFVWNKVDKAATKEIPNVMSINYADAEKVLKENGFKVTSIETDAGSILSNDIYNRSVKKGEVFKVNNSTYPNYTSTTKDKTITVYYAKDDYTYEEPEPTSKPNTPAPVQSAEPKEPQKEKTSSTDAQAWRQFLKDYEAWVDKYVEFMKKYKNNPTDIGLISEYGKFVAETAEWAEKSEKYEEELKSEDVSPELISEYMETLARITKKMSEIAY